jgi:predicted transglutaminase-like cysteine proteinase
MHTADNSWKTRLMARVLATVTVLAAPLAVTASPASATTANRAVSAEAALACATPCNWFSSQLPTRIDALKAAEQQAKVLAQLGYQINYAIAVTTATNIWKGKVNYQQR